MMKGKNMRRKRNADADRSQGEYKTDFVGFVQDSDVLDSLGVKQFLTPARDDGKAKTHEFFLLPAHDKDSQRFGLDLFVHYNIGVNKATVLCPKLMKNVFKKFGIEVPEAFKDGKCPVCELEQKLQEKSNRMKDEEGQEVSTAYWKKNVIPLRAYYGKSYAPEPNRYLSWVRPADNMSDDADIQFFFVPVGVFKEAIVSKSTDRHGKSIDLANPDAPYILYFQREGVGKEGTRYSGYGIESFEDAMPDSWFENVPRYTDILVFKTYEEIKEFMGDHVEEGTSVSSEGAAGTKDSDEGEFFEQDLENTRRRRKRDSADSPSPDASTGRRRKVLDVDKEDADKEDAIVEAEERKAIEQEEVDENTEEEVEALARKVRSRRRRTEQAEAEVEQEDDVPF